MNRFNEGKACDAILRHVERREGRTRENLHRPEQEGHPAPIELTFSIGDRLYAFEHTGLECGLEINKLVRDLKPFKGLEDHDTEYQRLIKEYHECLARYENHDEMDYREVLLESFRKTDPKSGRIWRLQWRLFFDNILEYWHYALTWVLMLAWAGTLFWHASKT